MLEGDGLGLKQLTHAFVTTTNLAENSKHVIQPTTYLRTRQFTIIRSVNICSQSNKFVLVALSHVL